MTVRILVVDDQLGAAGKLGEECRDQFLSEAALTRTAGGEGWVEGRLGTTLVRIDFESGQREGRNDAPAVMSVVESGWPFRDGTRWALVLLDVSFPQLTLTDSDSTFGLELLKEMRTKCADLPVVVLTRQQETMDDAQKAGATGFLGKDRLRDLGKRLEFHGLFVGDEATASDVLLRAVPSLKILREIRRLALRERESTQGPQPDPAEQVLLLGETGVGKTTFARVFGNLLGRRNLVQWTAGGQNPQLYEEQLFGRWKGAHSHADEGQPGCAECAHEGVLFLDEVGNLDSTTQSLLLDYLTLAPLASHPGLWRPVRRIGTYTEGKNVRQNLIGIYDRTKGREGRVLVQSCVVAATNADLEDPAVRKKIGFRDDLFNRLGNALVVPSLDQRKEDILPLFELHYEKERAAMGGPVEIEQEARDLVLGAKWPGNVRQLEQAAKAAARRVGEFRRCTAETIRAVLQLPRPEAAGRGGPVIADASHAESVATDRGPAGAAAGGWGGALLECYVESRRAELHALRSTVARLVEAEAAHGSGLKVAAVLKAAWGKPRADCLTTFARRQLCDLLSPVFAGEHKRVPPFAKDKVEEAMKKLREAAEKDKVLSALWAYVKGGYAESGEKDWEKTRTELLSLKPSEFEMPVYLRPQAP